MKLLAGGSCAVVLGLLIHSQTLNAASCESLRSLTLPNTTITVVQTVSAGAFTQPTDAAAIQAFRELPAFCRVAATLTPSLDSDVKIEVWLPASGWNGKFQAVGNGGWAGSIRYASLAAALQEGYAAAATDTGHTGNNSLFAIGHPEKLVDYAYRAVHETAVQAKSIISAYYSRGARLSYWSGCSLGGRQGLMAAQKYPGDFDAIVAGAPVNAKTHNDIWNLAVSVPVLKDPASVVPAAKLAMVNRAVVQACDARDGVTDGILNDPRDCTFDVAALQCTAGDAESCLTAAQVVAIKRGYEPARTAQGVEVFPGKERGGEMGWGRFLSGSVPNTTTPTFQLLYSNPDWDGRTFDLERDLKNADEKLGLVLNATNPDLRAFKARGGKLLIYHGWNDNQISPRNSIDYYTSVLTTMGPKQDSWIRLFMVPGMDHCAGGPGPNQVNYVRALERWRESGMAPDRLIASRMIKNQVNMTRPLCPYPQVAQYTGVGSTNDAANFVCKTR